MDGMKSGGAPEIGATPPLVKSRESEHIPALDGVRGLAILLVMACHFSIIEAGTQKGMLIDRMFASAGRFGWTGVDLFFVLSGFLITGILLRGKSDDQYFRNFYARRILRIFPLYYAVIALTFFVLPFTPLSRNPGLHTVSGKDSLYYWFYLSNMGNIFGNGAKSNDVLGVTWSLAIEEQFYMVWPLIVFLSKPRTLIRLCIALPLVSLLLRTILVLAKCDQVILYEFTICRFDAIALGSLIAVMLHQYGIGWIQNVVMPRLKWVAAASILTILGICAWHKSTQWDYLDQSVRHFQPGQTFGYSAVAVFFACLFLATFADPRNGWLRWFFSLPFMRFFGRYSYAIYLFHYPVCRVVKDYIYGEDQFLTFHGSKIPGQLIFMAMCGTGATLMALLSWNLLEKHCLALKRYFPTHSTVKISKPVQPQHVVDGEELEDQAAIA